MPPNQNKICMETKEYFEKVMQDFNQYRNGRSLKRYCRDEGIDYDWLIEYKKNYPPRKEEPVIEHSNFISLTLEEKVMPQGWQVSQLTITSPSGDVIEIKSNNLLVAAELLRKMS